MLYKRRGNVGISMGRTISSFSKPVVKSVAPVAAPVAAPSKSQRKFNVSNTTIKVLPNKNSNEVVKKNVNAPSRGKTARRFNVTNSNIKIL